MNYDGVITYLGGMEYYEFCCGGHSVIDVSTSLDMTDTSLDMTDSSIGLTDTSLYMIEALPAGHLFRIDRQPRSHGTKSLTSVRNIILLLF